MPLKPNPREASPADRRDLRWPLAIALGLATVVAVDGLFLYVASLNAPEIEPSYIEARR